MQILKKTESINWAIEALDDMPGIGRKSAERILAETGVEMEHFQNESRFSSWAGLVPECKESAGKKMSTRIRKGNKYLKSKRWWNVLVLEYETSKVISTPVIKELPRAEVGKEL